MIRNKIFLIPNILTTSSVLSGFISIIYCFNGYLFIAAVLIIFSFILDGLDGRVARITNTTSEFGAQYDSLADVVSFGVAPSVFLYQWFLKDLNNIINTELEFGVIIASLYLVSVLLRLARFNVFKSNDFFIGLPCPLGAILVSLSFILSNKYNINIDAYIELYIFSSLLISFLMISKFSYFSFKNIEKKDKIKFHWLFFAIIVLIVTLINPYMVLFLLAFSYALSGFFMHIFRYVKKRSVFNRKNSKDNKDKYVG